MNGNDMIELEEQGKTIEDLYDVDADDHYDNPEPLDTDEKGEQ